MRLSGTVLALLLAAGCQGTPDSTTASDADGDDHVDARPALLAELGAPDAFSITVDEVDGTVTRFESWSWSDELVQVDMVDGEVVWAVALDPLPEPAILPLAYDPTEFEMLVPIDDVRALLAGVELLEVDAADDLEVPGAVLVVGEQLLLLFVDGLLVSVEAVPVAIGPPEVVG